MAQSNDDLRALFAEELAALTGSTVLRSGLPLPAEDPDVARLLEALAFFSAKTRAVAESSLFSAVKRIAGGSLDDLLCPMPAMTMLRAVPDERLVKPIRLPQGTPVRVAAPDDQLRSPRLLLAAPIHEALDQHVALFTTTAPLDILPVKLLRAGITLPSDGRRRLEIRLEARGPLLPAPRAIELYVNRFGDYRASLDLHVALEKHCRRAFAVFDEPAVDERSTRVTCEAAFGGPWPEEGDVRPPLFRVSAFDASPFFKLRSFFHLPEQSLYVRVAFPEPKPWTTVTLCFELDDGWPDELRVDEGTFALFVVPVINLVPASAQDIVVDGTKDRYAIRSALPEGATTLHGVTGVYSLGDAGLTAVPPMSLLDVGDAYEIDDNGVSKSLRLRAEGAFEAPRKITVDALWYDPSFSSTQPQRLETTLWKQRVEGVTLGVLGALLVPAKASTLAGDAERCLEVLSLKMRGALGREDLVAMLRLLGARDDSFYAEMPATIAQVGIRRVPDMTRGARGLNRRYDLVLRYGKAADAALVTRFAVRIRELLDAWTQETVEVEGTMKLVPGLGQVLEGGGA